MDFAHLFVVKSPVRMRDAAFAVEEISKVFLEELDAALENEGREDVGAARVVEVAEEVPASAKATAGQAGRAVGCR